MSGRNQGPHVNVYRTKGGTRELIDTFSSKSDAIRFAQESAERERSQPKSDAEFTVEFVSLETQLKVASMKKSLTLGADELRFLMSAWIEATHGVTQTLSDRKIDGRRIALVLESFGKPKFKVLVDIKKTKPSDQYVRELIRFCKKQKANKAYLVCPAIREQEIKWSDSRLTYKPGLHVIPPGAILKEVEDLFTMKFEQIEGNVVLVLDPNKVYSFVVHPKD